MIITSTLQENRIKINKTLEQKSRFSEKRDADSVGTLFSASWCETVPPVVIGSRSWARGTIPFMSFVTRSRGRGNSVVKICERFPLDRSTHNSFECPNHVIIFRSNQCERVTCTLSASGAADAMDVGIGSVWHVEVDHVRNAVDVQTARRNVRGDHDAEVPCFEAM